MTVRIVETRLPAGYLASELGQSTEQAVLQPTPGPRSSHPIGFDSMSVRPAVRLDGSGPRLLLDYARNSCVCTRCGRTQQVVRTIALGSLNVRLPRKSNRVHGSST